jgi:hypothetical protein
MTDDTRLATRVREELERMPSPPHDLGEVSRRARRLHLRRRVTTGMIGLLALVGIAVPLLLLLPLGQPKPHHHHPAAPSNAVSGHGLSIELPDGWDGRVYYNSDGGVRVLQFANFPMVPVPPQGPEDDIASRSRTDLGSGQVVVVLTEYLDCECGDYAHAELPISLHPEAGAGIEGADPSHAFARLTFENGGRSFDLWADFGSDPAPTGLVDEVNGALATLHVEPAVVPAERGWLEHLDLEDQASIQTPQGWFFNEDPVPALLEPRVIFAASTARILPGGECAPDNATNDLPSDGALLWVVEYTNVGTGTGGGQRRPYEFPPRSGPLQLGPVEGPFECIGVRTHLVLFRDNARYFQVHVMFGPQAPDSLRSEVQQSLDSFRAESRGGSTPTELCASSVEGAWRFCPEAAWVYGAASKAGFVFNGDTGTALVFAGRGAEFYLWATAQTNVDSPSRYRQVDSVDGIEILSDGVRLTWIAQNARVWVQAGPHDNSQLPSGQPLADLVHTTLEVPLVPG